MQRIAPQRCSPCGLSVVPGAEHETCASRSDTNRVVPRVDEKRPRMRQAMLSKVGDRRGARVATSSYTSRFMTEVLTGGGAWRREARAVVALAAPLGLVLDEQMLIFSDVRGLQALALRLQ